MRLNLCKYKIKILTNLSKNCLVHFFKKLHTSQFCFDLTTNDVSFQTKSAKYFPWHLKNMLYFVLKQKWFLRWKKKIFFVHSLAYFFSAFYSSRWPIKSFLLWRSKNKTQSSNIVSVFCRISINIMHKILFFLSVC